MAVDDLPDPTLDSSGRLAPRSARTFDPQTQAQGLPMASAQSSTSDDLMIVDIHRRLETSVCIPSPLTPQGRSFSKLHFSNQGIVDLSLSLNVKGFNESCESERLGHALTSSYTL